MRFSDSTAAVLPEIPESVRELPSVRPVRVGSRLRLAGLLIVFAVAILPLIVRSILILLGVQVASSQLALQYGYGNMLLLELSSLGLLLYVLHQNGQQLSGIGLSFQARDIGHAFLLTFGTGIVFQIAQSVMVSLYTGLNGHAPAPPFVPASGLGVTLLTVLLVALNPVFEELIVRAFLISEVVALTSNAVLAVTVSVAVQTAYHLYQGIPYALASGMGFLVFSIYYIRTRRILPVILAHLWFDFAGLILYPLLRATNS